MAVELLVGGDADGAASDHAAQTAIDELTLDIALRRASGSG
jgi:hypothetical protein